MWWQVIAWIAMVVLGPLVMPGPKAPENAQPATASEFDFPTAEEGRDLTVIFGTVWIEDENVVWWGDFESIPIKKKLDSKK